MKKLSLIAVAVLCATAVHGQSQSTDELGRRAIEGGEKVAPVD